MAIVNNKKVQRKNGNCPKKFKLKVVNILEITVNMAIVKKKFNVKMVIVQKSSS